MTKYEKILQEDLDKKEKVLQILKTLDGEDADDAKEILDCAKFFIIGCAKFSNTAAKDWIGTL